MIKEIYNFTTNIMSQPNNAPEGINGNLDQKMTAEIVLKTLNTALDNIQKSQETGKGYSTGHLQLDLAPAMQAIEKFAQENSDALQQLISALEAEIQKWGLNADRYKWMREELISSLSRTKEENETRKNTVLSSFNSFLEQEWADFGLQAESQSFIEGLPSYLEWDKGFIDSLKNIMHYRTGVNITDLISIASILDKIPDNQKEQAFSSPENFQKITGYISNGRMGNVFKLEWKKVKKFIEHYVSNNDFKSYVDSYAPYVNAGLTVVDARFSESTMKKLNTANIAEYLNVTTEWRMLRGDAIDAFKSLEKNIPNFHSQLAKKFGIEWVNNAQDFADALKRPENRWFKADFFRMVNVGLASGLSYEDSIFWFGNSFEKSPEMQDVNAMLDMKVTELASMPIPEGISSDESGVIREMQQTLQSDPSARAKLKETIRQSAINIGANIGRGANTLGAGQSFETAIKGLSLWYGVGVSEGKVGGGVTIAYSKSFDIANTADSKIAANIGAGAELVSMVPFGNAGITKIDKIKTFGAGGINEVKTTGLNYFNGGGAIQTLTMNRSVDYLGWVDQFQKKMESVMDLISSLGKNEISVDDLKNILLAQWFQEDHIGEVQLIQWSKIITQQLTLQNANTPNQRRQILDGLVKTEVERIHANLARTTQDARSFKWFTVGVGVLGATVFPLAGLSLTRFNMDYVGGNRKVSGKMELNGAMRTTTESRERPEKLEVVAAMNAKNIEGLLKVVNFALGSRASKEFTDVSKMLVEGNDSKKAAEMLAVYLKKSNSPEAQQILNALNSTKDPQEVLTIVQTLTSGDNFSRALGKNLMGNKEKFSKLVQGNGKAINEHFNTRKSIAKNIPAFGNEFDSLYTVEKYQQFSHQYLAPMNPDNQIIGINQYSQQRWVRGVDAVMQWAGIAMTPELVSDANKDNIKEFILNEFFATEVARVNWTVSQLGLNNAEELKTLLTTGKFEKDGKILQLDGDIQVYKTLSATEWAVCFNAITFMEIPKIKVIDSVTKTETTKKVVDINRTYGRDYSIKENQLNLGLSGYSKPKEKQPETQTETKKQDINTQVRDTEATSINAPTDSVSNTTANVTNVDIAGQVESALTELES